jgi:hypothetical protein
VFSLQQCYCSDNHLSLKMYTIINLLCFYSYSSHVKRTFLIMAHTAALQIKTYRQSVATWTMSGYVPSSLVSLQSPRAYQGQSSPVTQNRTLIRSVQNLFHCLVWNYSTTSHTDSIPGHRQSWYMPLCTSNLLFNSVFNIADKHFNWN